MRKREFIHNELRKNKEVYSILVNHRILTRTINNLVNIHDGLKTWNRMHNEFENAKEVVCNFCANSRITSITLSSGEYSFTLDI